MSYLLMQMPLMAPAEQELLDRRVAATAETTVTVSVFTFLVVK